MVFKESHPVSSQRYWVIEINSDPNHNRANCEYGPIKKVKSGRHNCKNDQRSLAFTFDRAAEVLGMISIKKEEDH